MKSVCRYPFLYLNRSGKKNKMYLMIDNYDSFVYNLKAYFEELGRTVVLRRTDKITLEEIDKMNLDGIILSPGPKSPWNADLCIEVVQRFKKKIPILGICLGHQIIGYCAGAVIEKGTCPMHGKVTEVEHNGKGLFAGLPSMFKVTRYHSLEIKRSTVPEEYEIDCISADGAVMGISKEADRIYGIQYHPEALLTEYGHELLENFCKIAEKKGRKDES